MDKEKLKVGILNVQWVNNYGVVLLAYALQFAISNLGYDAEIIDYRPLSVTQKKNLIARIRSNFKKYGLNGIIKKVTNKISHKAEKNVNYSSGEKTQQFEEFRKHYLNRSGIYRQISASDSLDYDVYVVGSDVLWKSDRMLPQEADVYFLNFSENKCCRRIACAASMGTDDQERLSQISDRMKALLPKFNDVSAREKSSVSFVQQLFERNVTRCIAPTFLLKKEDYDTILNQEGLSNEHAGHYIYLYLFENNPSAIDLVNEYSKAMNLPVICQCGIPGKINNLLEVSADDGPAEFIDRIKNAELVITDSFHGIVFSIIYWKNFITLSRGKNSIRMKDLLERLGLEDRYIKDVSLKNIIQQNARIICNEVAA